MVASGDVMNSSRVFIEHVLNAGKPHTPANLRLTCSLQLAMSATRHPGTGAPPAHRPVHLAPGGKPHPASGTGGTVRWPLSGLALPH